MKKKLVSLALATLLIISIPISAFASPDFNSDILTKRDDLYLISDDMTGITYVYTLGWSEGKTVIRPSSDAIVLFSSYIGLTDPGDFFSFAFHYKGYELAGLDTIFIKIGDNRYTFSNCSTSQSVESNGTVFESISFNLTNNLLSFMDDLIQHRDEEIKVRLHGTIRSFDFTFTDEMKSEILTLYDIYANGGGLHKSNIDAISLIETAAVFKNGYPLQ